MNALLYSATIPRIFTALAEWCACVLVIQHVHRRINGPRLWCVLGLALVAQCLFLQATGPAPVALWLPCMAVAVGLMFLWIALCCDISPAGAAYCTARAFLLAEFAASLEWQLYNYFALRNGQHLVFQFWFCLLVVYSAVFFLVWRLEHRQEDTPAALVFQRGELWPPLVIGLSSFLMSNLSFLSSDTPFTSAYTGEIYNIRTLVDLAGMTMLYAYHAQRCQLMAQRELNAIQNVLQSQYAQYCQSRESIEVIDRKYHDLKHQIAVLRAEADGERRTAFLDEMEREIDVYQAQQKTGSPVLDTVLARKRMQCSSHQIDLNCTVDGTLLGFLDVMDLCTVFGNILDNAIECQLSIPEPEKRMIILKVYARKGFVVVYCENYCPEQLKFRDGLPVTTKSDQNYHGYGIKSIRYTAEKYGGSMAINLRDNWFKMTLLFPVSSNVQ